MNGLHLMEVVTIGECPFQVFRRETRSAGCVENDCLLARDCCRSYRNIECNRMWDDDAAVMVRMDKVTGIYMHSCNAHLSVEGHKVGPDM